MEKPFSTSKVTVEYFDPHGVYKLLQPGLVPRLPLHDLHWQSHAGPARSIHSLHIDLLPAGGDPFSVASPLPPISPQPSRTSDHDDGFTTQTVAGGRAGSTDQVDSIASSLRPGQRERRHQIPGLRRTPYLKVLLVRCDDNDTYKSQTRGEIREWIKENTPPAQSTRKINSQEQHDAFEWLIIHVVIPNTAAATQPRASAKGSESSTPDGTSKGSGTSRWRGSSSTLLEKLRSDFNGTGKSAVDRVAQIRIGINDVPYDVLPRVVPAVPSGYVETPQESESAWLDLVDKLKILILSSFDLRVSQYEEDIKEKDAQRSLPGWNFCTFFILKEGLARGFESVGLVEDGLVGYDELSVGLDSIVQEQSTAGSANARTSALLEFTGDLSEIARKALAAMDSGTLEFQDGDAVVDLQSQNDSPAEEQYDDIPISSTKKPYREMILANNVSVFDFRCYIFARQISLLLRLGNAWSTREELLAKLKEQQESVLHGVASRVPAPKPTDEAENLSMLAEICRRTLEFIPAVSQIMRKDIIAALASAKGGQTDGVDLDSAASEAVDNLVASFAFSVAQQILAQTLSKALPVPPSSFGMPQNHELKSSIPEPKTMMHPARSTSLHVRSPPTAPVSPGIFPGPGRHASFSNPDGTKSQLLKIGLEDLAARRAELYALSRNILEESGKKRGWSDGWESAPVLRDVGDAEMVEVDLSEENNNDDISAPAPDGKSSAASRLNSTAGVGNTVLRTALESKDDFYRLYETLTDKALRHYSIADHVHSVKATLADLALLKYHLQEYDEAASYFYQTTPFFGENGWTLLELSMLFMYAKCLRELQRQDKYVQVLIKLLSKAAAAEKDKQNSRLSLRLTEPGAKRPQFPERSAMEGIFGDLLATSEGMPSEVRIPLANFVSEFEVNGPPVYDDGQDSFSLDCRLYSLLADGVDIGSARAHLVSVETTTTGNPREIWLETRGTVHLKPGSNNIQFHSNQVLPGLYEINLVKLTCGNVSLHYERDPTLTYMEESILRKPRVYLFPRAGSLDVRLSAGRHIQLDKNNTLELELLTGWNDILSCELRVKSATGGLRLLMAEAEVISCPNDSVRHPEGALFTFKSLPASSSVKIRFPFTTEQELLSVAVKVEVAFTTEKGNFTFSTTPTVPVALALGVNVQDVFKHEALFSRFTVSTASSSPLRLFKSELLALDLFESHFGFPPTDPVVVFPKQPASLLYKITRRRVAVKPGASVKKTMYLKLFYSVVQEEIESLVEQSITEALAGTQLMPYATVLIAQIRKELLVRGLSPYDLERAALLGEFSTSFLDETSHWERHFAGLAKLPGRNGVTVGAAFASFVHAWQQEHPYLVFPEERDPSAPELRSILIPVDIPSLAVVHTADIRLQEPVSSIVDGDDLPVVCTNQLLPATLHLKWTRMWDTGDIKPGNAATTTTTAAAASSRDQDLEFSYEVTAPTDTWLLGGRRKGHFVIPAVAFDSPEDSIAGLSSAPDTEADIPLLLVPLREGWLPYPTVEIREVRSSSGDGGDAVAESGAGQQHPPPQQQQQQHAHCETDSRNLGETLRVVADRARVTLSLDASGPGGGPLVLDSEPGWQRGRAVI